MARFLDEFKKKKKSSAHVGVPPVASQPQQTKAEMGIAAASARRKEMPSFAFGNGTPAGSRRKPQSIGHHATPTYADPSFNRAAVFTTADSAEFEKEYQAFLQELRAKRTKKAAKHCQAHPFISEDSAGKRENECEPIDHAL